MTVPLNEWRPRGIGDLEDAAWGALRSGTAAVTAGPGSGKTELLAQRASYLLETGICQPPRQILAISFKRSAADNLRDRVRTRLPEHAPRFTSMTFDAFTKMIVDRFSGLLPAPWPLHGTYRIGYASARELADFLADVAAAAPAHLRAEIRSFRPSEFIGQIVGGTRLSSDAAPAETAEQYTAQEWWRTRYVGKVLPVLDFVMLNRLADYIVRSSQQLTRALSATYPFVFVDEFQDTTFAQYSFLRELFAGANTKVTVVGDQNQRIMGWAGALDNAFAQFAADFGGDSFTLTSNFRSSPELVDLQHRFATLLDPDAAKQASRVLSRTGESAAQVWSFPNPDSEARRIAEWVRADIDESGRSGSQYAILARQRVADIEPRLSEAFSGHGLRLRNDDALIGEFRLQDLLSDDLTHLLIDTVKLAASRGGEPEAWLRTAATLKGLFPFASAERAALPWEEHLSAYLSELRDWFAQNSEALPAATRAVDLVASLLDRFTDFLSLGTLGNGRQLAETPDEAQAKLAAIGQRLVSVLEVSDSWGQVADDFWQDDAVSLMTIHRSKGLEYHTVFIVGLDDAQWWAHARNAVESTMTFFVGVSRAAARLIFTYSTGGGTPGALRDLYDELEAAGVPFLEMQ